MGGITDALFGGSKSSSSSQSGNTNNDFLKNALGGSVGTGANAMSSIANLLGVGGADNGQSSQAFQNYLGSSGYKFMMDSGSKAITDNAATKGTLNSGATLKGVTQYGQNLGSTQFNNYLSQLQGLVSGGQGAANTIAGAGQFSKANSSAHQQNGIIPGLFG